MTTGTYPEEISALPTAVILLKDAVLRGVVIGLDPGIDSHRAGKAETRTIGSFQVLICAIQTERLSDLAQAKARTVDQRGVITSAGDISRVTVTRPPAHWSIDSRARALATRPGIIDAGNLRSGQCTIKDLDLIHRPDQCLHRRAEPMGADCETRAVSVIDGTR